MGEKSYRLSANVCALPAADADKLISAGDGDSALLYIYLLRRGEAPDAELAAALCERYGLPVSHIIRHYDVTGKLCPKYWVDDPDGIVRFRKLVKEAGEMVETSRMIVDGKEVPVERILKNGTNYVKIRDVAAALGLEVGNQGNVAVLRRKES